MTGAQRLVDAAKTTHAELGEVVLDLHRIEERLAALRRTLAFAVTTFDTSAVLEVPDQDDQNPRD